MILKQLLRLCAVLVLAGGLTYDAAAQDQADTQTTMVFNLTTDDVWTAQMSLGMATRMLTEDKADVVVFLNVRAAALANKNVPQHTTAMSGKTAHELIQEFIAAGGRVFVCPNCTKQAGLSLDDRIEGVEPGSPAFRQILLAPGTRIISY
ncbi:DsrE family protein [Rhodobacteraceae bacterium NNCM2]|nr:DsrE family protein [Coraliihabitans acroporae]